MYSFNDEKESRLKSLSFITSKKKKITLNDGFHDLYNRKNIASFFKKILSIQKADEEKEWYYTYVHPEYINHIKKYINVYSNDEIMKNVFALFLSPDQVNRIKNIAIIKKIEPENKYDEDGGPLLKTDYLFIRTDPSYKLNKLNSMPELFSIKKRNRKDSYIIKMNDDGLSKEQYYKKKRKIVELLSKINYVKTVSTYQNPKPLNHLATGYTQKNNQELYKDSQLNIDCIEKYMNKNGITGEGQVISILDSLLDPENPMFYDPNVPFEINKTMPNHRKILYYNLPENLTDWKLLIEENEHGTHVSGIAAGKSIQIDGKNTPSNLFDGNAPDAKIIYAGHLYYTDLIDVEKIMNNHNSRISSNSWTTLEYINEISFEIGEMANRNPQSLFIFGAGNFNDIFGNFSIFDPSGNKNILAIGAINHFFKDYEYSVENLDNPENIFNCRNDLSADFWVEGKIGTTPEESHIVGVDASLGKCDYFGGNHTTIIYSEDNESINYLYRNCDLVYSKGIFMTNDVKTIKKIIENRERIRLTYNLHVKENYSIYAAYYSSTGPANKGILKPDVVGPGTIIYSAKSTNRTATDQQCKDIFSGHCGLTAMTGTSMSTPNIAGAAALINHYFKSGKWIDKVDIDGTTLRALLINSAHNPKNTKTPDIIYGHGVVDLSTILPVEGGFGVQITPQWVNETEQLNYLSNENRKPSVKENGHIAAKLEVKSNKVDLQITLSYLDPELNPESLIPLNHDLDLVVVSPDGKIYKGDNLPHNDTQHTSTNEKIIIDKYDIKIGIYTIHVYGNSFADSPFSTEQDIAVVASGDIDNKYLLFYNSTESPCKEENPNNKGMCLCNENEIGPICQATIETINESNAEIEVESLQIKRIKFVADRKIVAIHTSSNNPGRWATIWASKECHLNLGDYEFNGETGENTTNTINANFESNEICIAIFNINDKAAVYDIELEFKCNSKSNKKKAIIIGVAITVAVIVIIIIVLLVFFLVFRKRNDKSNKDYSGISKANLFQV